MSSAFDLWMSPAKRRLVRRTDANGPYGPPAGTAVGGTVTIPAAHKLQLIVTAGATLTVAELVILVPHEGTGSAAARAATNLLRCIVDSVAGTTVVVDTAPTDLTGLNCAGLVVDVIPV